MNRLRQRGVALFTAVFFVVVLGAVAATVALISTTQQISSATGLDATRARYAALARLEQDIDLSLNDLKQGNGCPDESDQDFFGFTTSLDCTAVQGIEEGGDTYDVLTLTVTASRGSRGSGTRVRRQIRVQITRGL